MESLEEKIRNEILRGDTSEDNHGRKILENQIVIMRALSDIIDRLEGIKNTEPPRDCKK